MRSHSTKLVNRFGLDSSRDWPSGRERTMTTFRCPSRARAILRNFLICVLGSAALVAGASLACAQAVWEFGAQRLMASADFAGPLTQRAFGAAGLASLGVLTRIGGVNIEGVALFTPPTSASSLSINYNPTMPDGQRLGITAWGVRYTFNIPD